MAITKEKIKKWEERGKVKKLIKALADDHYEIRGRAAEALGYIGDQEAIEPLINLLNNESHFWVNQSVIAALGKIGDIRAVDSFIKVLKREVKGVGAQELVKASAALGKIGDPKAVEPLINALKSKDYNPNLDVLSDKTLNVHRNAAEALGKIGDTNTIEPLLNILAEGDEYICKYVSRALTMLGWEPANDETALNYYMAENKFDKCVSLGNPAVGPLIKKLDDKDPKVRIKAAKALQSLYKSKNLSPENKKAILQLKGKVIDRYHADETKFDPDTCHKDHTDGKRDSYFRL
jgi:HEAT repeat protein